jgi:predicted nucleotidyltransferase
MYNKDSSFSPVINALTEGFKLGNRTILSKEFIKQTLVDNRKTLQEYGVKRIGLFGSYVRGTATAVSDIDFLVELERLTFDDYMGLAVFLENLFKKEVDLVTPTSIKPGIKPYIEKEIEYVTEL